MGEHNISTEHDEQQQQAFMKALLSDLTALEQMLETGRIESGVRRIGAEQEMFIVDGSYLPVAGALPLLENAATVLAELGEAEASARASALFDEACESIHAPSGIYPVALRSRTIPPPAE